jgi:hypothetical protein
MEFTMGLDMYAYRTARQITADVDFKIPEGDEEFFYWRKHPNLHGWMRQLYISKGGQDPDFNVNPVKLTSEDLDALEKAIKDRTLPATSGFFFGASDGSEINDDLEFVAAARKQIADGYTVFYYAWW